MSPYQINILLHYHACADDYKDSAPILPSTIVEFMEMGLLEEHPDEYGRYKPTDKLHCYCEKLCSIEMPVQQWVFYDR